MSSHPLNLALRFLLEIFALVIFGCWGWSLSDGIWQYLSAFGLPILMAAMWGIFAVKNDPSRSGKTAIQTPGIIRLLIELVFFGLAFGALLSLNYNTLAINYLVVFLAHYILSFDRIKWLLKQ